MSSPLSPATAVRAEAVGVRLDGHAILRELTFAVPEQKWTTIIGPNGSGKTTLLRAIGGLIPYTGSLRIKGREVRAWSTRELARQLAFVRQKTALAFDFTVEQLVQLGRAPHKTWMQSYNSADRDVVQKALKRVDLDGFTDRSALTLSGGELQRVFLAQALVQDASILLLDEPTTHLDVHYQFSFMNIVAQLRDEGRTVIAVIHDLELAARFAEHLMVLDGGRLVSAGAPDDVVTSDLLKDVFRMHADVRHDAGGQLHVKYHSVI